MSKVLVDALLRIFDLSHSENFDLNQINQIAAEALRTWKEPEQTDYVITGGHVVKPESKDALSKVWDNKEDEHWNKYGKEPTGLRWRSVSERPPIDGGYHTNLGINFFESGFWDSERVLRWLDEKAEEAVGQNKLEAE